MVLVDCGFIHGATPGTTKGPGRCPDPFVVKLVDQLQPLVLPHPSQT